ncbi:hypothetical protein FOZ62_008674, partial [Perkinsus olseni]
PMLLDKEDPSLVGENNWMTRLPRAVYAWNAASYNSNSVLSPYMMVYGVPPRIPGAELTADVEELAQVSDEYIGNIVLVKNDPPNKDVLLKCKEAYDRDGSFPDLPAIAVTRELQQ